MAQKKPQPQKTKYQLWQETVDDGLTNAAWDVYDTTIQLEVADYNSRHSGTPGYKQVNWLLIKAMLWAESGGPKSKAWKTRPMQIGNTGDPGYATVKNGAEGSSVVMPPKLKGELPTGNINEPHFNIRVAIAYLFTRMAKVGTQSVVDSTDPKVFPYKVVKGDNGLATIAKKVGSTTETLQKLNPNAKLLHVNDTIQCQKASYKTVILGWRTFDTANIALLYNAGGDDRYAEKLDYVLSLFPKVKR